MTIEKLEHYDRIGPNGYYEPMVLLGAACAREDALLEALRSLFWSHCLNAGHATSQTCPICFSAVFTRNKIKESR